MDVERAKFAENALMYEFSLDRVGGHLKMMMELFQTLKDCKCPLSTVCQINRR